MGRFPNIPTSFGSNRFDRIPNVVSYKINCDGHLPSWSFGNCENEDKITLIYNARLCQAAVADSKAPIFTSQPKLIPIYRPRGMTGLVDLGGLRNATTGNRTQYIRFTSPGLRPLHYRAQIQKLQHQCQFSDYYPTQFCNNRLSRCYTIQFFKTQ